jgi:hypothetical protein
MPDIRTREEHGQNRVVIEPSYTLNRIYSPVPLAFRGLEVSLGGAGLGRGRCGCYYFGPLPFS